MWGLGLCFAQTALAEQEMTDDQKLNTVYRIYSEYKKDFPAVKDISPRQAMQLLDQNQVVFIDIRKPEEMAVSMLPGAVSQQEFLSRPDQFKHQTAVSYCTISYRSGVFAREMAKQGIRVINLQGGILAWTLEGGTVYTKDGNAVRRVHVYGDKWDYAPADYESVTFNLWKQLF
jgi:sodium/bile acid cotransporter 7